QVVVLVAVEVDGLAEAVERGVVVAHRQIAVLRQQVGAGADPVAQQRPQLGGVVVPGVIHIAGIERQDIVLGVELHPRPGGGSADKVGGGEFGGVVVVGAIHQGI